MLREGIELDGEDINLEGLTDPDCTKIDGIPNSEAILRFSNAFMGQGEASLEDARAQLANEMGVKAMVDAVGVASNFQRMDRIADATGIPSDGPIAMMQEDLVTLLGTDKYASAVNTPSIPWWKRIIIKLVMLPKIKKRIKELSN